MIRRTPQQIGRDYEFELAERYGGTPQPASGAGPRFKLDCKLGSLLVSAKRTTHESYSLKAAEMREALAGAQGPGGRGEVPAMAIRMEGFDDDLFALRGSDLLEILQGEVEVELAAPNRRQLLLGLARAR